TGSSRSPPGSSPASRRRGSPRLWRLSPLVDGRLLHAIHQEAARKTLKRAIVVPVEKGTHGHLVDGRCTCLAQEFNGRGRRGRLGNRSRSLHKVHHDGLSGRDEPAEP